MSEIKNQSQVFEALAAIAKNNLLTMAELKNILETAIFKSFHSKFDADAELELTMDEVAQKFELINNSKVVVSDEEFLVENRPFEIPFSVAKKINKNVELYDTVAEVVDFSAYSKQVAGSIRAMLTQSVKERRKEAVWEKHQSLKGEMINVVVKTITPLGVAFEMEDGTSAYMPSKLRNSKISLKIGQRATVFVEDVLKESKDSQVIVSNGSKVLVRRVLESEVPEIAQGIIEIVNISRIPGERSKVAVRSTNPQVDPVGAIIGSEGSRINSIVNKLEGEKLDVIVYSEDQNTYIANAFAPARIISVIDRVWAEGELAGQPIQGHKIVIAPDKHQTLAIGKFGSNARLVVELVNSRIDVMSLSEAKEKGINIVWNGNITLEEVEKLEAGERLQKAKLGFTRAPRTQSTQASNYTSTNPVNLVNSNSFDADIASFNVSMEDVQPEQKGFEVDEIIFSEEELRAMEASFEFDDELPSMPESDEEFDSEDEE